MSDSSQQSLTEFTRTHPIIVITAAAILIFLSLIVIREWVTPRDSQILIPAGGTYLGPS